MRTTPEQRTELKRLAESVDGWRNCNKAWLDTSEDEACATVGHIGEDGEKYPLAFIDCNQYFSGDSMKVAKFYAAAMEAIPVLLSDLEEAQAQLAAERHNNYLRAKALRKRRRQVRAIKEDLSQLQADYAALAVMRPRYTTLPVDVLLSSSLEDPVHTDIGRGRPAKVVRVRNGGK